MAQNKHRNTWCATCTLPSERDRLIEKMHRKKITDNYNMTDEGYILKGTWEVMWKEVGTHLAQLVGELAQW